MARDLRRLVRPGTVFRVLAVAGILALAGGFFAASASPEVRPSSVVVYLDDLPPEFDSLRVAHLSDLHAAGLKRQGAGLWDEIARRANAFEPDLLVFTGDYGTLADMARVPDVLGRIDAPLGRYAVLGNHDFGPEERADDNWSSPSEKQAMIAALRRAYADRRVRLLFNESVDVTRGSGTIRLAGVGVYDRHHGFHDARLPEGPTTVLLAHSPEYWEAAVRGRSDAALTLCGHTHGAQIGVGVGRYTWSPAALMFSRWRGLHREGSQWLYVNTGVGVFGLPFRVNMPAEVALIELRRPSGSADR